jgi:molybdopterin synthase catalytic subunit
MHIDIFYFATMRTLAGVKQEKINLPVGATVEQLKIHLANRNPEMAEALNTCLVSVDRKLALPEQVIVEGQEVAIFPPISGGGS